MSHGVEAVFSTRNKVTRTRWLAGLGALDVNLNLLAAPTTPQAATELENGG